MNYRPCEMSELYTDRAVVHLLRDLREFGREASVTKNDVARYKPREQMARTLDCQNRRNINVFEKETASSIFISCDCSCTSCALDNVPIL